MTLTLHARVACSFRRPGRGSRRRSNALIANRRTSRTGASRLRVYESIGSIELERACVRARGKDVSRINPRRSRERGREGDSEDFDLKIESPSIKRE